MSQSRIAAALRNSNSNSTAASVTVYNGQFLEKCPPLHRAPGLHPAEKHNQQNPQQRSKRPSLQGNERKALNLDMSDSQSRSGHSRNKMPGEKYTGPRVLLPVRQFSAAMIAARSSVTPSPIAPKSRTFLISANRAGNVRSCLVVLASLVEKANDVNGLTITYPLSSKPCHSIEPCSGLWSYSATR